MEIEFNLPDTFPTQESAIEAAIKAGRQKIDLDSERGIGSRERISGGTKTPEMRGSARTCVNLCAKSSWNLGREVGFRVTEPVHEIGSTH